MAGFRIGQRVRTTVDTLSRDIPAGTLGTILNYNAAYDYYHVLLDTPEGRKGTYGGDELAPAAD
ncbi:hypothetical protein [Streptomyces prasinus]